MTQEENAIIQKKMNILLEEAFENVQGYFLSKNTSILETLKSINSNIASRLFENGKETIVGHVKHTLLALKYSKDYLKKNDLSKYEWNKEWKDTANDDDWKFEPPRVYRSTIYVSPAPTARPSRSV